MEAIADHDPVCGMPVDASSTLRANHAGREYLFCSALCRDEFLRAPTSFVAAEPPAADSDSRQRKVAYFTMEIAVDSGMPTYSGGLGVLAGDMVRSCADLAVPLVAVTLLHRRGYFRQVLDFHGGQREEPVEWSPDSHLQPLQPAVNVTIEGRRVRVGAWQHEVAGSDGASVPVIFLDTDVPENSAFDRSLSGTLYGGDERYRFCQEAILGIGGVRMLRALGYAGIEKYHLNEGHAALAPLELLRELNAGRPEGDWRLAETQARCVFTTHTPVAAGHDQFERALVDRVLGSLVPPRTLAMLGGAERLNMTSLALNLSHTVNGVARRHAEVSRAMFPGYGIHHVTNGVHSRTWTSPSFQRLFERHLPGWASDPALLRNAMSIPGHELWQAHIVAKADLLAAVHNRCGRALDPEALTIGFARRATQYKRPDLILSDLRRLRAATDAGPLQLIFAGKAHPRDEPGKALIRRVFEAARELGNDVPVIYLPDYDLDLAKLLVAGTDLWLNTPLRPLEASGTSGMKAAHNGVPSFSVLDGWWLEGHVEGVTGWAIGPRVPTSDPAESSARDIDDLYAKLAQVIAPMFHHERERWTDVMKHAIALNASFFNTHRMVQQYVTNAYL